MLNTIFFIMVKCRILVAFGDPGISSLCIDVCIIMYRCVYITLRSRQRRVHMDGWLERSTALRVCAWPVPVVTPLMVPF